LVLSLAVEEAGVNVRFGASRPLQLYLLAHWHHSQGQLADRIPLDHPFLDPFLKWWTKPANVLQGKPIQVPVPQLAVYMDAFTSET